jgi:hypothetical protein
MKERIFTAYNNFRGPRPLWEGKIVCEGMEVSMAWSEIHPIVRDFRETQNCNSKALSFFVNLLRWGDTILAQRYINET